MSVPTLQSRHVMPVMSQTIKRLCLAPSAATPSSRLFAGAASRRSYAFTAGGGAPAFQIFNRHTKWLQKERAASNPEAGRQADYLKDEVANRLCERLLVRLQPPPAPSSPSSLCLVQTMGA